MKKIKINMHFRILLITLCAANSILGLLVSITKGFNTEWIFIVGFILVILFSSPIFEDEKKEVNKE